MIAIQNKNEAGCVRETWTHRTRCLTYVYLSAGVILRAVFVTPICLALAPMTGTFYLTIGYAKNTALRTLQALRFIFVLTYTALLLNGAVSTTTFASGLEITNLSTPPETLDIQSRTLSVSFDISWRDSWRTDMGPINWDAAWVFVKFRGADGTWRHASLERMGHSGPPTATITPGLIDESSPFDIEDNPAVGVFIHRASNGSGSFSASNIQLRWNYGADGIAEGDSYDIKVFGVEMVYIEHGGFYAGDSSSSTTSALRRGVSDYAPWYILGDEPITSTSETPPPTLTPAFFYPGGGDDAGSIFTIPGSFPKGFNPFYVMKYELTQEQYAQFFNTLPTGAAQQIRDITSASGKAGDTLIDHNNLSWPDSGEMTLPNQATPPSNVTYCNVAANYLSWGDLAAWLDWAGLRPITELEYEKCARGPFTPAPEEYAWGGSSAIRATGADLVG